MSGTWLFTLNLIATWYMVGLIWMVQVVHYNLFDRVGEEQFLQYEADHSRLITPIVGIPMLVEIVTAVALLLSPTKLLPQWAAWTGLAFVIVIWLSTAFIQVPCHQQLSTAFSSDVCRRLVASNWIRTVLWSGRGLLLAYFLVQGLSSSNR